MRRLCSISLGEAILNGGSNYVWIYMTGGSYRDKDMKLLTYDEAKNIKTFNPICSMRIFKEHVHFRSFIYFNFRMIVIDTDMAKQIWYEKVNEKEEFLLLK